MLSKDHEQAKNKIFISLFLAGLAVFYFWYANQLRLLAGFPKGRDVYAYLFRIRFVKNHFPHLDWNHLWDSGTPFFIWSYPPLSSLIPALLSSFFGLPETVALTATTTAFLLVFFISFAAFLLVVTESTLVAFASVMFLLANPAVWGWWADGGNYARVIGLGFYGMSLFFTGLYLKAKLTGKKVKFLRALSSVFLHFCFTVHFLLGAFAALTLTVFIFLSLTGFGNKTKEWLKIFVPALLLSAYFLLPFLFGGKPVSFLGKTWTLKRILWPHLVGINPEQPFSSWPRPFLAGVGLVLFLSFFLGKKKGKRTRLLPAGFWTGIILGLPAVLYLVIGNFESIPYGIFINGLPPSSAIVLPTILLTMSTAFGSSLIIGKFEQQRLRGLATFFFCLILVCLGWGMVADLAVFKRAVFNVSVEKNTLLSREVPEDQSSYKVVILNLIQNLYRFRIESGMTENAVALPEDEYNRRSFYQVISSSKKPDNFRFGANSAYVADWFNFYYPQTPQTRDFFAQGVPYPDWIFSFEQTVWKNPHSMPASKFWLDWYGVKNFFVDQVNGYPEKFINQEGFSLVSGNLGRQKRAAGAEFKYHRASPILSPVDSRVILVIGSQESYRVFFRNLAAVDQDSRQIISIDGGPLLVEHLPELERFDTIFLYGYQDKSPDQLVKSLLEFVRNGGRLVIATNPDMDQERAETILPEVYPVKEFAIVEYDNWQLEGVHDLESKSLKFFSAPVYEGGSWKVAQTGISQLRDWVKPLVLQNDQVLVAKGNIGEGEVIWSGFNLPFHADYHQNLKEAGFLIEFLGGFSGSQKGLADDYSVEVKNPGKHAIILNQAAKGVLFKQNYFPSWQAKIINKDNKKEELKIYPAGPSLMFVFLKQDGLPVEVVFEYRLSWLEKVARLLSLFGLLWLVDFVFGSPVFLRLWPRKVKDNAQIFVN